MRVQLAYGKTGLPVDVPDDSVLLSSRQVPGLTDEVAEIRNSLRSPIRSTPLRDMVAPGDTVIIVHTDITRATPNERILPVLLGELEHAGVRRRDITLLNALGTHRPQTKMELRHMLGDEIVDRYRCLQHDAWDDANLVSLGQTSYGHPVRINRIYAEANVKILTGFIEPHFFAGFSGGPKGVLPSIAGFESVLSNHGYDMIAHSKATWGITTGNPIWEEMREVAQLSHPSFLLNVAMNDSRQITAVFSGDLFHAHAEGCQYVRSHAFIPVEQPFDIVLTTNSGYPLDQNLYQSIKGVSAAARVVRPGGAILLIAECCDGLPAHGGYAALLQQADSPQGILDMLSNPDYHAHDQWTVQIQAQIQLRADVYAYSKGLTERQIEGAMLMPVNDLPTALAMLRKRYGPRICILPQGPQCIAVLSP